MKTKIERIGMGTKPDPFNFVIKSFTFVGGNTIITANYPGCLTFGGDKLMLLKGEYGTFETLDPHFFEDHPVVARFVPTQKGMNLAVLCAKNLD